MFSRGPYRRHPAQCKLQLCHDIRSGSLRFVSVDSDNSFIDTDPSPARQTGASMALGSGDSGCRGRHTYGIRVLDGTYPARSKQQPA